MNDYWKNHYNNNAIRFSDSLLKQVDRTVNGLEIGQDQLELTINSVRENLQLDKSDNIVDLCCGNGLVTCAIASDVNTIVGVDFSNKLIEHANQMSVAPNLRYLVEDVTMLDPSFYMVTNKVYMRDSVSCLDSQSLLNMLINLRNAENVGAIFIAGVPDASKLNIYYDDDRKMQYYLKREADGKPHIGNWWSRNEMRDLVRQAGLRVNILDQNSRLASAFYRYDCIIEK